LQAYAAACNATISGLVISYTLLLLASSSIAGSIAVAVIAVAP
jgi:hypothetical protein